jgi:hypothetical protein
MPARASPYDHDQRPLPMPKNRSTPIKPKSPDTGAGAHADHPVIDAWHAATTRGRPPQTALRCRFVLTGALFLLITLVIGACDPSTNRPAAQPSATEKEANMPATAPPKPIAWPSIDRDIPPVLATATFALG